MDSAWKTHKKYDEWQVTACFWFFLFHSYSPVILVRVTFHNLRDGKLRSRPKPVPLCAKRAVDGAGARMSHSHQVDAADRPSHEPLTNR